MPEGASGSKKPSTNQSNCNQRGCQVPAQVNSQTWQIDQHDSDFRVRKETVGVKGLWNLPLQLRRMAKTRHVARESLKGGLKRPLHEAKSEAWNVEDHKMLEIPEP